MDWGEFLKNGITPVATFAVPIIGYKLFIGRAAKQADLLDRFTKEIAVRDALLKLKVSASEPDSAQQINAKESTYKQAEELEERLKKGLAELTPKTPPEMLWWRQSSMREKFLPKRYEGKALLSVFARLKWWWRMSGFYTLLVIYSVFMWGAIHFLTMTDHVVNTNRTAQVLLVLLLALVGLCSLWISISFRRDAYIVSLQQQSPSP